jgi:hypothetical protein
MINEHNCKVNAQIFKQVRTPQAAYILGLLWADGYIRRTSDSRSYVTLEIMYTDAEQLLPIFKHTGDWYCDTRMRKNRKPISRIMATNHYLFDYLNLMGYKAKSHDSANKILCTIPLELQPYWWRGYFDGDGCIYVKGNTVQASISSAYNQQWDFTESLLNNLNISFNIKKRSHKCKNGNLSHSSYVRFTGKHNVLKFYQYIYGKDLEVFGLSRKLIKFKSLY